MKLYSLTHLSDRSLLDGLASLVRRERATVAELLAHMAEVEARELHAADGYPSMLAWCVGRLHLSEHSAFRRIRVARAARKFPVLFEAIADGRLNLTSALLLAPFLATDTVDELVREASHQPKAQVEELIARRYPRQLAPELVGRATIVPISPGMYEVRVTIPEDTLARLRYSQELLSHQVPAGNMGAVLDRLLELSVPQLEKQKFAAAGRPHSAQRPARDPRHIPARVKQAVWKRDGGACTFVSKGGRRCGSRWQVEFDHVEEVARGGRATAGNVRLLCRTHNQFAAAASFGAGFMEHKRQKAMESRAAARDAAPARGGTRVTSSENEVIPYLRKLGYRTDEARRRAAAACERMPDGPLEGQVRSAISGACFA